MGCKLPRSTSPCEKRDSLKAAFIECKRLLTVVLNPEEKTTPCNLEADDEGTNRILKLSKSSGTSSMNQNPFHSPPTNIVLESLQRINLRLRAPVQASGAIISLPPILIPREKLQSFPNLRIILRPACRFSPTETAPVQLPFASILFLVASSLSTYLIPFAIRLMFLAVKNPVESDAYAPYRRF